MEITYQHPQVCDAQQFWNMMDQLDRETKFMLYEPGEREQGPQGILCAENLIEAAASGGHFLLTAQAGGEIVGFVSAQRGGPNRIRHTAHVVTGIREGYRGRGIGTEFFRRLDTWARTAGVTRLELTVMCPNVAAKRLYEKSGFVLEGVKRNAVRLDGDYVDELYMAKLLAPGKQENT